MRPAKCVVESVGTPRLPFLNRGRLAKRFDNIPRTFSTPKIRINWARFMEQRYGINGGAIIDHQAPRERRFVAVEK